MNRKQQELAWRERERYRRMFMATKTKKGSIKAKNLYYDDYNEPVAAPREPAAPPSAVQRLFWDVEATCARGRIST